MYISPPGAKVAVAIHSSVALSGWLWLYVILLLSNEALLLKSMLNAPCPVLIRGCCDRSDPWQRGLKQQ